MRTVSHTLATWSRQSLAVELTRIVDFEQSLSGLINPPKQNARKTGHLILYSPPGVKYSEIESRATYRAFQTTFGKKALVSRHTLTLASARPRASTNPLTRVPLTRRAKKGRSGPPGIQRWFPARFEGVLRALSQRPGCGRKVCPCRREQLLQRQRRGEPWKRRRELVGGVVLSDAQFRRFEDRKNKTGLAANRATSSRDLCMRSLARVRECIGLHPSYVFFPPPSGMSSSGFRRSTMDERKLATDYFLLYFCSDVDGLVLIDFDRSPFDFHQFSAMWACLYGCACQLVGSPFLDACPPRQVLDLHAVDPEVGGFLGGFAWEGYGYLVPCRSFQVNHAAFSTDHNSTQRVPRFPLLTNAPLFQEVTNLAVEAVSDGVEALATFATSGGRRTRGGRVQWRLGRIRQPAVDLRSGR